VQHANKKLICCLLAVEIADYEAKPIFDQVRLTQDFHNLLDATVCATSHDLVSIVEEDGAVLAFLCDPDHCLRTALEIRAATLTHDRYRELQLRIGIDLGKALIAEDDSATHRVTGEGRQDADRLMRQGSPGQISVSRRFVELLLRGAPEMAELLEYRGLYSDNLGPLDWYRVSAAQDTASEGLWDRSPKPALPSDVVDIPRQPELAPVPGSTQLMARFQTGLQHPRLRYAPLVLVVGAALVALWSRVSLNAPTVKPAAQLVVVTPQTIAPEPPKSLLGPAESLVGHAGSLSTPVAPEAEKIRALRSASHCSAAACTTTLPVPEVCVHCTTSCLPADAAR
jgi:hypothetical protein